MNRAPLVAVALIASVLASACSTKPAPPKLAPDQAFVQEIRGSVTGSLIVLAKDSDVITFGHSICNLLDGGESPADLAAAMIRGRKLSEFSPADAAVSISGAVKLMCPRNMGPVQAWNGEPTPSTTTLAPPPSPPTTRPRRKH